MSAPLSEEAKLRRIVEIQKRAIDRWVPCPDCRDKVNRDDGCLACRLQKAQRDLAAARASLLRKEQALVEARHWIVSMARPVPGGIISIIDAALGASITPETKP